MALALGEWRADKRLLSYTPISIKKSPKRPLSAGEPLAQTCSWVEGDGQSPAGDEDPRVQRLHRLLVRGHNPVFPDQLQSKHSHQRAGLCSEQLEESNPPKSLFGALTQQRARCSCSSARRRPTHILLPMPKGTWEKGWMEPLSSQRSGLNSGQPLK